MPNHVTNILRVSGDPEKVSAMFEAIKDDEIGLGSIDFNKIIPMPESLDIEWSSRTQRAMKLYQDFCAESVALALIDVVNPHNSHEVHVSELIEKYTTLTKDDPDLLQIGEKCCQNIQNHGYPTWYQWSVANWGSKWNSYGYDAMYTPKEFDGEHIEFRTAWDASVPAIAALAEKYPDLSFELKWADEDFGHNTGKKEYKNGEEISSHMPLGGSKEALELAAEIQDVDLADEGYLYNESTGEYEYHDPEESMSLKM